MTLFDSFKRGMKKTRDLITGGLNRITASVTAFDETMLDELEALMVQADLVWLHRRIFSTGSKKKYVAADQLTERR